ncbi:MAG: hypothetical protein JKY65_08285 [Planctomycetes bacterium]|nr:hypothetical protein [Planctomycetota bacterium]
MHRPAHAERGQEGEGQAPDREAEVGTLARDALGRGRPWLRGLLLLLRRRRVGCTARA